MTNTDFKRVTQLEGGVLTLTWPFPENLTSPSSISGAVITGTMQNIRTGDDEATPITGALTAVSATTFTWDMSAEDSGTAGTFLVIFRAVVSGVPTYTLAGTLVVDANPAVTAVAAPPLVGVPADDAAWVTDGAAGGPLGTAAYEDTAAFASASDLDTLEAALIPVAVANLAAVTNGHAAIDLSWTYTAIAPISGFKLYRKTGIGGTYTLIDSPDSVDASFNDTGLNSETTYYYRLDAYNTFFTTASNETNATTDELILSFIFSEFGDGALPAGITGSTWAISGGKAVNTPTLGTELLTNGNMETGDPPTGWATTGTISSVADERTGGTGIKSLNLDSGASSARIAHEQAVTVAGNWVVLNGWGKGVSHPQHNYGIANTSFVDLAIAARSDAGWLNTIVSARAADTGTRIYGKTHNQTGATARYDDMSLKVATTATLYAYLDAFFADATVRANGITQAQYTQAGVIANLDDATAPANFVIGYYDRANGKARLDKCVAGTYTNLVNNTATYAAGAEIEVVKSGTTYQLWYNSVQQGTDQTISDAGIVDNTIHGLFSTGGGASVDAFFCE